MWKTCVQTAVLLIVLAIATGGDCSSVVAKSTTVKKTLSRPQQSKADGQIRAVYRDSKNRIAQAVVRLYRQEKLWENAAKIVTSKIRLPRHITVSMQDCGRSDAVYNHQDRSIVICNELTARAIETWRKSGASERDSAELTINFLTFIFYDRVGQMLVRELNLPVTSQEKDIVDRFATYVLLEWIGADPDTAALGYKVAIATSHWLEISDRHGKDPISSPSLSKPELLSLLCMLYIKNPDRYDRAVDKLGFTPDRLRTCRSESIQIATVWNTLLKPHAR